VGPSNYIFVGPAVAQAPTVNGETVVTSQKTNARGKPLGKKTISGFTIQYSLAMDPTTVDNSANYQLDATTIKRNKGKMVKVLTLVKFKPSYDPSSDSVTLKVIGKNPFAMGGQITIAGLPPNGVRSQAGAPLSSNDTFFHIGKNAKSFTLV
jgi:hypothetical protein